MFLEALDQYVRSRELLDLLVNFGEDDGIDGVGVEEVPNVLKAACRGEIHGTGGFLRRY